MSAISVFMMTRHVNRYQNTITTIRKLVLDYENYLEKIVWSRNIQWSLDKVSYDIAYMCKSLALYKHLSFRLRISSINVIKSMKKSA